MSVSSTQTEQTYSGIVAGTPLNFNVVVHNANELQVIVEDTGEVAVSPADYSVTIGGAFTSATVTPTAALVAKAAGSDIIVRRVLAYTTDIDIPLNSRLDEARLTREFDRTILRFQQIRAEIDRYQAEAEALALGTIPDGSLTLPKFSADVFATEAMALAGTDNARLATILRAVQMLNQHCFLRVGGLWGADDTTSTTSTYTVGANTHAFLLFQRGAGGKGGAASAYAGGGGGGQGGGSLWLFTGVTPGAIFDLFLSKGASGTPAALSFFKFPLDLSGGLDRLELQVSQGTDGSAAVAGVAGKGGASGTTGTNTPDQDPGGPGAGTVGYRATFPAGWGIFHYNYPSLAGHNANYNLGGNGGGVGDIGFGGNGAAVGGSPQNGFGAYFCVLEFVMGKRT